MKKPSREEPADAKPQEMPDPFVAMEKAFDKPEAIEALANLRDMFTLAAKAARGDESALLKVARNNLGPKASNEEVRALAAQLRESLRKR